ncbi:hypothetical protein AMJ57_02060 [Parcubacteria bacterium SG8_24]|nr:MAG: hypothetical protein AMJ57_02060 [Parcubacteria bacterium SG8_24]
MSVSKKITGHLTRQKVKFEIVPHKKVYTAYDLAQTLGERLDRIAKSVLVKVELPSMEKRGARYYVVVVPASYNIDMQKLKKALRAKKAEFAPEKVMKRLGIEPGALSPFGSLRDLGVVVDKGLLKVKEAIVGAESFTESLRLKVKDLVKTEGSLVAVVGKKNRLRLQKKTAKKRPPAKKKVVRKKVVRKRTARKRPAAKRPAKRKGSAKRRR